MELWKLGLIFLAGSAMGFVNAVSAAGSLIALPVLILTGLPPSVANGTNRIGVLANTLFSILGFRSKGIKPDPEVWKLCLYTIPGSVLGALYATKIPEDLFNRILAVVMLLFLVITLRKPVKKEKSENGISNRAQWLGAIWYLLTGFYGGFLQAGTGFFLMAGATLIYRIDLVKANYYKALVMLVYTIAALMVFVWSSKILWSAGLVLAAGTSLGGWFGSRWSVELGEKWVQRVIIFIIISFSIKLWFFA